MVCEWFYIAGGALIGTWLGWIILIFLLELIAGISQKGACGMKSEDYFEVVQPAVLPALIETRQRTADGLYQFTFDHNGKRFMIYSWLSPYQEQEEAD